VAGALSLGRRRGLGRALGRHLGVRDGRFDDGGHGAVGGAGYWYRCIAMCLAYALTSSTVQVQGATVVSYYLALGCAPPGKKWPFDTMH